MRNVLFAVLMLVTTRASTVRAQTPADSANPHRGTLYVVGVSHLDTQWRWTIQNTINEYVPTTFRDNFKLMDQFPDYTFSFEGAFRYMLLKEYYPVEYERLKSYIANGRWRVAGSWVDAVDVNMPSFESLTRNALYGNGYFKREFGTASRDVLLPDCFGFGYALPSIAAHCGLKSFSTQKLTWGSAFGVPFDIGIWEGVDGSSLVAALNPGDYVSTIRGDLTRDTLWAGRVERQGEKSGLYAAYRYFGTGDTGGSPDSASVSWLEQSLKSNGPLTVRSIGSDDLADIITSSGKVNLPRYKGELLMTRHGVGCYSSEAAMKRWNRKNELLADAAERASVIAYTLGGLTYPRQALRETWVRFLWHQFHDDLTGTSIPEAYEFSWNDEILCLNRFAGFLTHAVEATTLALDTRVKGTPLVIYNPLSIPRQDVVEATIPFGSAAPKYVIVYNADGKEVPSQVTGVHQDSLRILFLAEVPSVGYAVYGVRPETSASKLVTGLRITAKTLENQRYVVTINDNGDVSSIFDKREKRELLAAPVSFQLLHDKPKQWPAWEIQYEDIMGRPTALTDKNAEIRIVENGPVRVGLEVTRKTEHSIFRSTIRLSAGTAADRVEFENDIDWYERETLLKAAFVLTTPNDSVTYDLGLGTIRRGLNRLELYEVPGHQWAEMTAKAGDYGVAVLNDCKYGWDHPDDRTLRLSLIHTPGVFDNWAWVGDQSSQDNGHHRFSYAVYGHLSDWRDGAVVWQAARFNQPLVAFQTSAHEGVLGKEFSFLAVDGQSPHARSPHVMVNAVKLAENSNEIIVRVRELAGKPADGVQIRFAKPIVAAREVNGVEEAVRAADIKGGALTFSLTPYQPKAFAVTLGAANQRIVAPLVCQPVQLPFDLDGISVDSDRRDGDFDGTGITLSGDLLPDTLMYHDIPFVFGPKSSHSKNVVTCDGQTLTLPAGSYNRLYVIAAAIGGPADGTFSAGNRDTHLWLQDFTEPLGQWNNRLIGTEFIEQPERIAPSYINRAPVAWVGTHRHSAAGANEAYRFTYVYCVQLPLTSEAHALTLPKNPRIRVLAATAVNTNADDIRPAQALYDIADHTLTKLHAERNIFLDRLEVRMSCPNPGAIVHYTLDGNNPTTSSPMYAGPLTLTQTTTVRARAFLAGSDDSYITGATFRKLILREPILVKNPATGLNCAYYEGQWTKLPHFDSLAVKKDTVVDTIGIPGFARKEYYGLVFTGYLRVAQDGLYDFFIDSDDGSALRIADTLLLDNDGVHGSQEISEAVALKAGLHPIAVYMFQGKGGQALGVSWQGPGLPKQPVPANALYHSRKTKRR